MYGRRYVQSKIKLKRAIQIISVLLIAALLQSYALLSVPDKLFGIPAQTLDLFKLMGYDPKGKQAIKGFQISSFVTYREYKEYLNAIKKDSSEVYYQTQLPHKNIASTETWNKYIESDEYDGFPVLGISWDNAMNFCRWKTLRENKDSIRFVYRLPNCSEWLAAQHYLSENKIPNDMNKNYSDWLLNVKDESAYDFTEKDKNVFPFDYVYWHRKNDSPVLKRKWAIGDSYLYQQNKLVNYYAFSYYANEGYRQISFRYVKEMVTEPDMMHPNKKSLPISLLEYWGIKSK